MRTYTFNLYDALIQYTGWVSQTIKNTQKTSKLFLIYELLKSLMPGFTRENFQLNEFKNGIRESPQKKVRCCEK